MKKIETKTDSITSAKVQKIRQFRSFHQSFDGNSRTQIIIKFCDVQT